MLSTSPSRPLELGAVAGPVPNTFLKSQVEAPGFPTLSQSNAANFVTVVPKDLPGGTILYRAFGFAEGATTGNAWEIGGWWSLNPLPATEADWRGLYAIEVAWNSGQGCVAWTLPQDFKAWVGPAAPQAGEYADGTPADDAYLPGGGMQVFIPNLGWSGSLFGNLNAGLTPWNKPAPKTASTATPTDSKPATLAEAVAILSEHLSQAADTGDLAGVDTTALSRAVSALDALLSQIPEDGGAVPLGVLHRLRGIARHLPQSLPWTGEGSADALHPLVETVVGHAVRLLS
jgi:hypothetical protein